MQQQSQWQVSGRGIIDRERGGGLLRERRVSLFAQLSECSFPFSGRDNEHCRGVMTTHC